ncbi:MAG: type II secretion system F family protein [Proteobacteria bacterium]|nr:type II secretion system F family protein [Pseudomonadota bacterium]
MAVFVYTGQNAQTGKKVKATVDADSLKDAKLKLRKQNILVIDIKPQASGATSTSGEESFWSRLQEQKVKDEDIALATKQFAILIRAAVDVSEALRSISEQVENPKLRIVYSKIRESVSEGRSLSEAHRDFSNIFPMVYINMIAAAEKAGALPVVLRRLAEFTSWQIGIKRKVVGALITPAIMVVVAIGVTLFLFVNVLPKITKAFSSLKVTLPWYSVMLNNISAWLQQRWWIVVLAMILAVIGFLRWKATPSGRRQFDIITYSMPIFGPLVQRVAVSRFSKTLSTVLSSGVRIVEGLQLTRNVVDNAVLEDAIDESIKRVQDGEKLAAAIEKTNRFPVMVVHMLRTGEKTGRLEEMLVNIAEAYDDEVDYKIESTTKLINPLMTIMIAGIVMLMVMSVLGPMMQAMNSLK